MTGTSPVMTVRAAPCPTSATPEASHFKHVSCLEHSDQIPKRLTLFPISQGGCDLIQRCRGEFDMAAPISLREDFDGPLLRALVLSAKAGIVTRRLLALVTIYDRGTRADAARLGGVGLQTLRDWVLRFNAKGPDGLVDGKSTGRCSATIWMGRRR